MIAIRRATGVRIRRAMVIAVACVPIAITPACSDLFMRSCERGRFVGLLVPDNVPYPLVLKVGASVTVSSNYGTGTGQQGENCDKVLYTSFERPELFQFFSTDPSVASVSSVGVVTAVAPGKSSVYAVANGIQGRTEQITVVP
jgi:hypothetical protein